MCVHSLCIPLTYDLTISPIIIWSKETLEFVGIIFQFSLLDFQFNKIQEAARDTPFWSLENQLWFASQNDTKTANSFSISWCNVWTFGWLCARPSYHDMFSNSNNLLNTDSNAGFLNSSHVLLKICFFNLHIRFYLQ